jgi:hypothetical protein
VALATDAATAVKMRWTWQGGTSPDDLQPRGSLWMFAGSDGLDSSMPQLPARVNGASRALLQYDLTSASTGRSKLAVYWSVVDMVGVNWGWQSTQHSVNVVLDDTSGTPITGDLVERTTIDGVAYDVYYAGPQRNGSTYNEFRPVTPLLGKGRLDILAFSSYMKGKGWMTGEEKLAFVQLSNQAWDGEGETVANTWYLQVN